MSNTEIGPGVRCKGSILLRTGCMRCESCLQQIAELVTRYRRMDRTISAVEAMLSSLLREADESEKKEIIEEVEDVLLVLKEWVKPNDE